MGTQHANNESTIQIQRGNTTDKMIGNGVSVPVGEWVGNEVMHINAV